MVILYESPDRRVMALIAGLDLLEDDRRRQAIDNEYQHLIALPEDTELHQAWMRLAPFLNEAQANKAFEIAMAFDERHRDAVIADLIPPIAPACHGAGAGPRGQREAGVYVFDVSEDSWHGVGKSGLAQKIVRCDDRTGHSFGFMSFDTLARTGVHQHVGTAFSYFLSGASTDFQGTTGAGELGVNFAGSTDDAVAYLPTLTVGRMEDSVAYGPDVTHSLHAGNRHTDFENELPEHLPDVSIGLEAVQVSATRVAGLTRRLVYDYANTLHVRRMTQLMLLPGTKIPARRLSALVDAFVLAGDLSFVAQDAVSTAEAGDFVVMEPGTQVTFSSRYGASLLVWADGPSIWEDGPVSPELYSFTSAHGDPLRFGNRAPVDMSAI